MPFHMHVHLTEFEVDVYFHAGTTRHEGLRSQPWTIPNDSDDDET